uniref:RNA-directed RNA polymerase n=1 Tax=Xiangshan tombus-like virus TaxID=2886240 RepID=A0A8K1P3L0_9TOMB|nr:MAG: RNA dependent RNA polymerase [Xiangshan tombus-like virus]
MAPASTTIGKLQRLLTRIDVVQWRSNRPSGIRCRYSRIDRRILYFPSILKPNDWYYYPQDNITTVAAFTNRHDPVILPEYDPKRIAGCYKHIKKFVRHPNKLTKQQYVDRISDSTKRALYQRALADIEQGRGYSTRVQPFTKIEKLPATKYKAPRMIQARHLSFNIEYGVYIKPLEDALSANKHFGKGNYLDIGRKVHKLQQKYRFYTEADHSNFDAHITVEQLRLTHTFYQSCYRHNPKLRNLSSKTLSNSCSTRDGVRYKARGSRMSGDVDTSLGNSLINYAIIKDVLHKLNISGEAIVNGDDSIIFTNTPIPQEKAAKLFLKYNQETKIMQSQSNIRKVEFCRTKLIMNNHGQPTMMIDPIRLNDIFGMTYKSTSDYSEHCRQVIACNIACNSSNPLYSYWKEIYEKVYGKLTTAALMSAMIKTLEKKHKMIALKNMTSSPDEGEFNPTVYEAHGNIDRIQDDKNKLIQKLSRIKAAPRLSIAHMEQQTTAMTILVNHQAKTITKI